MSVMQPRMPVYRKPLKDKHFALFSGAKLFPSTDLGAHHEPDRALQLR